MSISEFENIWITKVEKDLLKSFPDDFIGDIKFEILTLPRKPLIKGSELFGSFEIIDTAGNSVLTTDSSYKLKYILYANRNLPEHLSIPMDENEIKNCVKNYEKHLDEIVHLISEDHKKLFPNNDDTHKVVNRIFQLLNLHRH